VDGELDLAIVALPIPDDRLEVEALLSEVLLVALAPGHRLTRQRRLTIQHLAAERFILLHEMHCLGEQVLSFCRAHECQVQIACRSAQVATLQSLIALNQGLSLLPDMARRADHSRTLVYRPLTPDQPRRTVAVIWHKHHYHSPMAERFLAELRRWAAALQEPPSQAAEKPRPGRA
jgi:LysR family hydrogen peroxide-inducible transcriptional activator